MAKYQWLAGSTDRTILVYLQDSSSSTGAGLAGIAAADLNCRFIRVETDNDVTIAQLSLSDLASLTAAHSDGGWFEVDATNAPGWYRLDLSDAVLAAGAWSAGVSIIDAGANDVAPWAAEIELVAYNSQDGVRLGLTALPNAAADAAGGLIISDAGGLDADAQLVTKINAILDDTGTSGVVVASIANGAITAAAIANGAIDAATFAADVDAEILSYLVDDATRIDASALNTATGTTIPAILVDTGTTLDGKADAIKAKTDLIPGTQDGLTFAQSVLLSQSVLLGKASGLDTTTAVYRSADDGEDRVTATVDEHGNRSAVTLNTA